MVILYTSIRTRINRLWSFDEGCTEQCKPGEKRPDPVETPGLASKTPGLAPFRLGRVFLSETTRFQFSNWFLERFLEDIQIFHTRKEGGKERKRGEKKGRNKFRPTFRRSVSKSQFHSTRACFLWFSL